MDHWIKKFFRKTGLEIINIVKHNDYYFLYCIKWYYVNLTVILLNLMQGLVKQTTL